MTDGHGQVPGGLDDVRARRQGVRMALDELERALASPARGRADAWGRALADRLDALHQAFAQHVVVTEADDGLFAEVLAEAPRLGHRIQQLRDDHGFVLAAIERLSEVVRSKQPLDDGTVEAVRDDAFGVLRDIVRHRQRGAELVYDAYNVDIEAAD
jgi:Hemerythrin HHE cation binding domain